MHGVYLNSRELEALRGLSPEAVTLYCILLRPMMDLASGRVGARSRVSWGRLALDLTRRPVPGIKRAQPHTSSVRRRGLELERAGLVKVCGSVERRELELVLLLASRKADSQGDRQADRPPHRGKRARPTDRPTVRATHIREQRRGEKTPPHPPAVSARSKSEEGEVKVQKLRFPPGLATEAVVQLSRALQGVTHAQAICDELGAAMQAGAVRHPVRLALHFIKQARNDEFIPEHGPAWARKREEAARAHAALEAREAARGAEKPELSKDEARAKVDAIAKKLGIRRRAA